MNFSDFRDVVSVGALLLGIANIVWVWMRTREGETATRIKEISDDLEDHERRIQSVESELRHLPSKDDFAELRIVITQLQGSIKTSETEIGGIGRSVRRIEDHLRTEKA